MELKEQYPHVFYFSSKGGYYGIFVGTCSLIAAMYLSLKNPGRVIWVAGALIFSLVSLWFGIRNLLNTKPALKLGPTGLWTPKIGFHAWKHVQVKVESVYGGKAGMLDLLTIRLRQSEEPLEVIALIGLGGPTGSIEHLIKQYKR